MKIIIGPKLPNWNTLRPRLHRSLEAQGFRQVPIAELTALPFHLPGMSPEIDAALNHVRHKANWVEIVRQLSQLKVRAFVGLHLRRDGRDDLEIVPIYAWNGKVQIQLIEEHLDWIHPIVKRLQDSLGKFTLSSQEMAVINAATTKAESPILASIFQLMVDISTSTAATTSAIFVDADGLDPGLAREYDRRAFGRLWPNVYTVVIDGVTGSVHGNTEIFSSLNLTALRQHLKFLAGNG